MFQDVLLEVQGQKVAGYTRADVNAWINHCSRNRNPVVIKTAPQGRNLGHQVLCRNQSDDGMLVSTCELGTLAQCTQ